MISALLHMQKSSNQKLTGDSDIISTMYKIMKQMKTRELKALQKDGIRPHTKSDVLMLNVVDSQKKYEIEKS